MPLSVERGIWITDPGGRGAERIADALGWLGASGACRDRTGDLRLAKPALSQLS
jgi:hypothetical protein